MWPTGRNEILIDLFKPVNTLQARYCISALFLFWPVHAVISIKMDFICSYAMILEVVMEVVDNCVGSFSCVHALVD